MRTRASHRSPSPSNSTLPSSGDEGPQSVTKADAEVESRQRRKSEQAAQAASKSAKKVRNRRQAAAAATKTPKQTGRPQEAQQTTVADNAPLTSRTDGKLNIQPATGNEADNQRTDEADAHMADLPGPSDAVTAISESQADQDDDRLPEAILHELLAHQRKALPSDSDAQPSAGSAAQKGHAVVKQPKLKRQPPTERQAGPVTVKVLRAHQLQPSERAVAFAKQQLMGSGQKRSNFMLVSSSQEEAIKRYRPKTKSSGNKGNKRSRQRLNHPWK